MGVGCCERSSIDSVLFMYLVTRRVFRSRSETVQQPARCGYLSPRATRRRSTSYEAISRWTLCCTKCKRGELDGGHRKNHLTCEAFRTRESDDRMTDSGLHVRAHSNGNEL